MPIKWTPEIDQLLLLKILETQDVAVDAKKIAAAWPNDRGEMPTPRAITERLVKIRSMAKANGASGFNISSSQVKGKSSSGVSKNSTPRKSTTSTSTPKSSSTSSPTKRKLDNIDVKGEPVSDDEALLESPTPTRNTTSSSAMPRTPSNVPERPTTVTTGRFAQPQTAQDGYRRVGNAITNLDGAMDVSSMSPMARLSVQSVEPACGSLPTEGGADHVESPTKKIRTEVEIKKEHLMSLNGSGITDTNGRYDEDEDEDEDAYAV